MRTLALTALLGYVTASQLSSLEVYAIDGGECFDNPFSGAKTCNLDNGCWTTDMSGYNCWGDYTEHYEECESGDSSYKYTDPDGFYSEQVADYDHYEIRLTEWDWAYYGCSGTFWDYYGACESHYLKETTEEYAECWEEDADWGYYEWKYYGDEDDNKYCSYSSCSGSWWCYDGSTPDLDAFWKAINGE